MPITFLTPVEPMNLAPVSEVDSIGDIALGKDTFHKLLRERLKDMPSAAEVRVAANFWPSQVLLNKLYQGSASVTVVDRSGAECLSYTLNSTASPANRITMDVDSLLVHYPWDLLAVNEECLTSYSESSVLGTVRNGVTVDGILHLGKNSIVLPGVYIEGTVIIGENCKIGPNCYVRGSSSIGNNCRIGQAVEVKNSIIMSDTAIGHLSYVGDSIIGRGVNLGAGTITANFRHDGACHRSRVGDSLVDTGRTKFGTVIGDGVHTGVHTSIYPGRKLSAYSSTRPGAVVSDDIPGGRA